MGNKKVEGERREVHKAFLVLPNHLENPAHTYINQQHQRVCKDPFYSLLFPTLLPINIPYKTQHQCLKVAKLPVSFL